jgi:hypothetical protein
MRILTCGINAACPRKESESFELDGDGGDGSHFSADLYWSGPGEKDSAQFCGPDPQ